jgi:hypothetical protein
MAAGDCLLLLVRGREIDAEISERARTGSTCHLDKVSNEAEGDQTRARANFQSWASAAMLMLGSVCGQVSGKMPIPTAGYRIWLYQYVPQSSSISPGNTGPATEVEAPLAKTLPSWTIPTSATPRTPSTARYISA